MTLHQLVLDTVRLLEGKAPTPEEAAALARLVGSREEWLAHLLLRRGALHAYPEIVAAIQQAAASAPRAATERPMRGDATGRRQEEFLALDAALQARFADDVEGRAEVALRQFKLRG